MLTCSRCGGTIWIGLFKREAFQRRFVPVWESLAYIVAVPALVLHRLLLQHVVGCKAVRNLPTADFTVAQHPEDL